MSSFLVAFLNQSKWHRIILFCTAILIYANTINNDFVLDDNIVLKKNEYVKKGFSGIKDILTHDSFKGFFMDDQSGVSVTGGRYRPLTLVVFAMLYPAFGMNPMYYHLLNILVFGLLVITIYQLVSKLLSTKFPDLANPMAFLTALLFTVHPIHTEVVSNVKGLDEISSLLFAILASLQSIQYLNSRKVNNLIFSFFFFALSIFSKESAINFLFLIPLGLILFKETNWKSILLVTLPIVTALLCYIAIRYKVIGFDNFSDVSRDVLTNPFLRIRGANVTDASLIERLGMIFYSLGKYLQLMVFPHPLTHDYFPLHVKLQSLFSSIPFISLLLIIFLIILAVVKRKQNSILSYGIIALVLPLLFISNLFFPMGTPMGERFAFTASLGFCMIAAYGINYLLQSKPKIAFGLLSLVLILYSAKTFSRNFDWKNEYALFSKDVQISSNSIKAHSELAYHLIDKIKNSKDTSTTNSLIAEALPHLERTIQLYPKHANAIYLTGNLYYLKKDYDKAATNYEKYLDLVPTGSDVIRNLQVCYREHGRQLALKNEDLDKAIDLLMRSLKIKPNDARVLESLGIAYGANKEFDQSIDFFNRAIKLEPNNAMMIVNLANTYFKKGDKAIATETMKAAYRLDPSIGGKLMNMQKPYN
ncbi:MAG: tetratricopeptide repeat protein [Saprospiraceae bacterium]